MRFSSVFVCRQFFNPRALPNELYNRNRAINIFYTTAIVRWRTSRTEIIIIIKTPSAPPIYTHQHHPVLPYNRREWLPVRCQPAERYIT